LLFGNAKRFLVPRFVREGELRYILAAKRWTKLAEIGGIEKKKPNVRGSFDNDRFG
jgi:hypothetical protein